MTYIPRTEDFLIVGRPRKIFLGIPLRDEWRGIDRSILKWIGVLSNGKHRIVPHVEDPTEPVELARNLIAQKFLRTDCDALLMIDQDQRPQSSAVKLLDAMADITAGFTLLARNITDNGATRRGLAPPALRSGRAIDPRLTGTHDVDSVGFGAVLIKRRVIEDRRLWEPGEYTDPYTGQQFALENEPDEPPPIFTTLRKPNGRTLYSEDFHFCMKAHALGYSVSVHMDARFGHAKSCDFLQIAGFGDEAAGQPNGYVLFGTADVGG